MQYEKKKVRRLKDLKKANNFVSNNAKIEYSAFHTFLKENFNNLISKISFENVVPPKFCPGYALMKSKIPCIFSGHFFESKP